MLKGIRLFVLFAAFISCFSLMATEPNVSLSSLVGFKENKGQVRDFSNKGLHDILYYGGTSGLYYYLTKSGFYYQLIKNKQEHNAFDLVSSSSDEEKSVSYCVEFKYKNCNLNTMIHPNNQRAGIDNYYGYTNTDIVGVKSYNEVRISSLYDGIDMKWYLKNDSIEYDYIIKPHADVAKIKIVVNGTGNINVNHKGELEISTPLGKIVQSAPVAYQDEKQVTVNWLIKDNEIGFEVGEYDRTKELIIDPIIRLWGTYAADAGSVANLEVDALGNSFLTGSVSSASSFIGTPGVFQPTQSGTTGYTVKFNTSGIKQWGTYLGNFCDARSSALDGSNAVYVVGLAGSLSIIPSIGAHQTSHAGGTNDAYLIKLNASNGTRMWGTFYGGNGNDYALSCAVDALGNIIIGGSTSSTAPSTAIATPGAYQNSTTGSGGFIAKFNSSGVRQWGTYYTFGQVVNLTSDASQNIYITGNSSLPGVATSTTVHQSTVAGGWDAFLTKFNASGAYQWGTYFGGSATEDAKGIDVDAIGNIYISGVTYSSAGISTSGTHQQILSGTSDAFLSKFNNNGNLIWSTYFGGSNGENVGNCFTDGNDVFLCGQTTSTINISTPGSYQTINNGSSDGYLSKFSSSGLLMYSTYYGSPTANVVMTGETDGSGNYYVAIAAGAAEQSFFASPGYTAIPSMSGAALAKFRDCPSETLSISAVPSLTTACSGQSFTLSAITSITNSPTFQWDNASTSSSIVVTPTGGTKTFYVYVNGVAGCRYVATYSMQISNTPTITGITSNTSICLGSSVTLNTTVTPAPTSYYWSTGANSSSITITPTATAVYSVNAITGSSVCISPTRTVMVTVVPGPSLTTSVVSPTVCSGSSNTLIATGATSYTWSTGATTSSIIVTNTSLSQQTYTYSVRGSASTCASTVVLSYTVIPKPVINIVSSSTAWCTGQVSLNATGASTYTWSTSSNSSSITVSPSVFTSYSLTGMAAQCTNSASIVVQPTQTVNVNVSSTSTLLCTLPIQQTATLTGGGAFNYLWLPGSSTSTSIAVSPNTTTTYTLIGSNSGFNCQDTTTIVIVASACTGIGDGQVSLNDIELYPNPTSGELNIKLPDNLNYKMEIRDVLGRIIKQEVEVKGYNTVDLSEYNKGIYFIYIKYKSETHNYKVIKH